MCVCNGEEVWALLAHSSMFEVTVEYLQDAFAISIQIMGLIIVQKRRPVLCTSLNTSRIVKVCECAYMIV